MTHNLEALTYHVQIAIFQLSKFWVFQFNPGFFKFCPVRIADHANLLPIETISESHVHPQCWTCLHAECIQNFKFNESNVALQTISRLETL